MCYKGVRLPHQDLLHSASRLWPGLQAGQPHNQRLKRPCRCIVSNNVLISEHCMEERLTQCWTLEKHRPPFRLAISRVLNLDTTGTQQAASCNEYSIASLAFPTNPCAGEGFCTTRLGKADFALSTLVQNGPSPRAARNVVHACTARGCLLIAAWC